MQISGRKSWKCDHVRFPNHPQKGMRKACNKELLKPVKCGGKYKFVPRKIYVYYNIIESLQRLVKTDHFFSLCEEWRNRATPPGWLTDVYNGQLWKDWSVVNGSPFLDVPG